MNTSRRTFSLGLAALGLTACSTGGSGAAGPSASTGLPADLRPQPNSGYDNWVVAFKGRAGSAGIADTTLSSAFRGTGYLPGVVKRDRNQTEFSRTLEDYLAIAASDERVSKGRAAFARHRSTLAAVEQRYGVSPEIVTAIWGLESFYGERRGNVPVVSSTSTLAYDGRRGVFFEKQLIAALKIIQNGDTSASNMTGSWAGAMGHTQFIPTSYLAYAVDFTGDGKRDIWSDDPSDALASTAAYLANFGWVKGQPWGVEVRLPSGFNYAEASRKLQRSPDAWAALGVRGVNGQPVPNYGRASILLPAGAQGAAFMIFKNFSVIERYNAADAYVIGVGHLSDRLGGAGPIQSGWPTGDRALKFAERKELQRRLTSAGFNTQGVDGKIGPLTIDAIRGFQRSIGVVPDGYASLDVLKRLR